MTRVPPSRRQFLGLLMSTALATVLSAEEGGRAVGGPLDQGIGGTGAAPPQPDESDRGIGGTGVIGTIHKFGSIYVNDLRIAYPPDAEVRIDGRPGRLSDLKIGQVIRLAAKGKPDALSTRQINVTHEVIGPIEKVGAKEMTVLGQTVSTEGLRDRAFAAGDTVAVSGLRRNDGTIVASLVEPRPGAPSRVAGPVTRGANGALRIGALPLFGADPALAGRRAVVDGRQRGDVFIVARGTSEATLLPRGVRALSIETYVERRDGALALGSGYAIAETRGIEVPAGESVRAVLTTSIGRDGRLTLESVRAGGRTYGPPPGRGGPGGRHGGGGIGHGGGHGGAPHGGGGSGHGGGPHGPKGPRGFDERRGEMGGFGGHFARAGGRFGGPGGFGGGRGFGGRGGFGGFGGGRGFGGGGGRR